MGLAVKKVLCRIAFGGNGAAGEASDMDKARGVEALER